MVVKVPIIGALAFLVLLDVCEGAGSCIHLFAEQFELSAGSLHAVPASVYLEGFVSGMILHLRLFTGTPMASNRLTISRPSFFSSSTSGRTM